MSADRIFASAVLLSAVVGCGSQAGVPPPPVPAPKPTPTAPVIKPPVAFNDPDCRVLIAMVPRCADPALDGLGAMSSGDDLAKRLQQLRFRVTKLNGTDASPEAILEWMRQAKGADRVLVVLMGHGVERVFTDDRDPTRRFPQQVFLTSEAKIAEGGLYELEMEHEARQAGYPAVFIFDTCRTKEVMALDRADPRHAAAIREGERVRKLEDLLGVGKPASSLATLYAAQSGARAANEDGLTASLIEALAFNQAARRFSGQRDREGMRFLEWFQYAAGRMIERKRLSQMPSLHDARGLVDQYFVSSVTEGPAPIAGTFQVHRALDLNRIWRPDHGGFDRQEIEHLPNRFIGKHDNAFVGGYVASKTHGEASENEERLAGFLTDGRALFLEVVATVVPTSGDPPAVVPFGVDVKSSYTNEQEFLVNQGGLTHDATVRPGRVEWIRVPLQPGNRFNYFALTHLNEQTVFTVRRMFLDESGRAAPELPWNGVVTDRWWPGSAGRVNDVLPFEVERIDSAEVVRVLKGDGWIGGRVAPGVWVAAGDMVELTLENLSSDAAQVTVSLNQVGEGSTVELASDRITAESGSKTYQFKVDRSGFVNEMIVSRPEKDFRFFRVEILPKAQVSAGTSP
jgi:hypothetical protein